MQTTGALKHRHLSLPPSKGEEVIRSHAPLQSERSEEMDGKRLQRSHLITKIPEGDSEWKRN